jgi:hypothetical protein
MAPRAHVPRPPSPNWLVLARSLVWLAPLAFARPSLAMDDCHGHATRVGTEPEYRVRVASALASYDNVHGQGDYEGLTLGFEAAFPLFRLGAYLPAYRLVRNGVELYGPGDALLNLEGTFAQTSTRSLLFGAAWGTSLPTGSSADDLGMGHAMVMPSFWLGTELGAFSAKAHLGYGIAVGEGGASAHAHHGIVGPIVAPMNPSEVELSLALALRAFAFLELGAGGFFATPVAMQGGEARGTAYGSLTLFPSGRVNVRLEGHGPWLGDPFLAKARLAVAVKF